jgi:hypothetical protein
LVRMEVLADRTAAFERELAEFFERTHQPIRFFLSGEEQFSVLLSKAESSGLVVLVRKPPQSTSSLTESLRQMKLATT